jgi:hypothetical protein
MDADSPDRRLTIRSSSAFGSRVFALTGSLAGCHASIPPILLVLLALIAFRGVPAGYFTDNDTFALIDSARIDSIGDIGRILSEPVMNVTGAEAISRWFRPVFTLSFSVDYLLHGLNPSGYGWTNLLLHGSVALLLYRFARIWLRKETVAIPGLAAILFLLHPLSMETVPATARRHDMLMTLFLLLTLISWLESEGPSRHRGIWKALSLVFSVLALGSKECAVLLIPVLFALFLSLRSDGERFPVRKALANIWPYLAIAVAFLIYRSRVLSMYSGQALGGYAHRPYGMASTLASGGLEGGLIAAGSMIRRYVSHLLYLRAPAGFFFPPDREAIANAGALLALALGGASIVVFRNEVLRSEHGRRMAFLGIWLALPLLLCLVMDYFSLRNLYFSLIPLSLALGFTLSRGWRSLGKSPPRRREDSILNDPNDIARIGWTLSMVCSVSIFAFSPLFHDYGEWRASGEAAQLFFSRLEDVLEDVPEGSELHFHRFPGRIRSFRRERPPAVSGTALVDYSVQSWLNLNHPELNLRVQLDSSVDLESPPCEFVLDVSSSMEKRVDIRVIPKGSECL